MNKTPLQKFSDEISMFAETYMRMHPGKLLGNYPVLYRSKQAVIHSLKNNYYPSIMNDIPIDLREDEEVLKEYAFMKLSYREKRE